MQLYQSYFCAFPNPPLKMVRDDFLISQRDLHRLFLSSSQLCSADILCGYNFSTLFDLLILKTDVLSELKRVDLCVIVALTPEFDPSYTHIGSYLLDRYALSPEMIDLTDNTPLPHFCAFSLLHDYFSVRQFNRAALLSFEQGRQLCIKKDVDIQNVNRVGALFFSAN